MGMPMNVLGGFIFFRNESESQGYCELKIVCFPWTKDSAEKGFLTFNFQGKTHCIYPSGVVNPKPNGITQFCDLRSLSRPSVRDMENIKRNIFLKTDAPNLLYDDGVIRAFFCNRNGKIISFSFNKENFNKKTCCYFPSPTSYIDNIIQPDVRPLTEDELKMAVSIIER